MIFTDENIEIIKRLHRRGLTVFYVNVWQDRFDPTVRYFGGVHPTREASDKAASRSPASFFCAYRLRLRVPS